MAIRLPLQTIAQFDDSSEIGAGSVAGGVTHSFIIPQDTDNVVVKFTASIVGAVSTTFQTTDDGGTTWYDVARTSVVSNTAGNQNAEWLNIPVSGPGFRSTVIGQNSVAGATNTAIALNGIGSAAASTLSSATVSGLPLLSPQARVVTRITGNITTAAANSVITKISANSQSATA